MREFAIAYEIVSSFSFEEAREKFSFLKRYLLPAEREIPRNFFKELMISVFGVSERDLSLIRDQGVFFIHLYNLTLRKANGEELVKDEDREYALYEQYRDLVRNFPNVRIDDYDEEVVKFFAKRHREEIERMVKERGLEKRFRKCMAKPRLGKGMKGKYLLIKCYSDAKKDVAIAQGVEEHILPLYALAVAYHYIKNE